MKILTLRLPVRQRARLVGKLRQAEVVATQDLEEALRLLQQDRFQMLVYYEVQEDSLRELGRCLPHLQGARVLFCAAQGHSSEFQTQLVQRLRVTAILQQPVDPDELVRRAAVELDTRAPEAQPAPAANSVIPKALAAVWERHQATNRERAETLVEVAQAADPPEDWLQTACRAAHQLAGSLGTFGLHSASLLARDAERLFGQFARLTPEQRARLQQVTRGLQLQVEDPQLTLPDFSEDAPRGSLLLVSLDPEWTGALAEAARIEGYRPLATDDAGGARRLFALEQPERGLIDLHDFGPEGPLLLMDLAGQGGHFLGVHQGLDRIEDSPPLYSRETPPETLLQALEQTPQEPQDLPRKVLAVDDDPIVLETLGAFLSSLNLEVYSLSDPLNFWERLEESQPDLVFLDVDLPYVGGVELCRAMRSEPRYFDIPVIFLSAYNDTETVQRVFAAGADDYVFKPILGPELVTRTRNRLRRARLALPPAEAPRPPQKRLAYLLQDAALEREFCSLCQDQEIILEALPADGEKLLERLTCEVSQRPPVILLDALTCHQLLPSFEGLGINNYSRIWVRGQLDEEDILSVFEMGLAGYLPEALPVDLLVRKLSREL